MTEMYCDYGLEDEVKEDHLTEEQEAFLEQSKEDWQNHREMHK